MTREEAIEELKILKENYWDDDGYGHETKQYDDTMLALDMAIKALEQKPTTKNNLRVDAVSRKDVHDMLENLPVTVENKWFNWLQMACMRLAELPSVTPIRPKGHWIKPRNDDGMSDPIYYQVRCSECGFDLDPQTWYVELHQYGADNYCPKCGSDNREVEKC